MKLQINYIVVLKVIQFTGKISLVTVKQHKRIYPRNRKFKIIDVTYLKIHLKQILTTVFFKNQFNNWYPVSFYDELPGQLHPFLSLVEMLYPPNSSSCVIYIACRQKCPDYFSSYSSVASWISTPLVLQIPTVWSLNKIKGKQHCN